MSAGIGRIPTGTVMSLTAAADTAAAVTPRRPRIVSMVLPARRRSMVLLRHRLHDMLAAMVSMVVSWIVWERLGRCLVEMGSGGFVLGGHERVRRFLRGGHIGLGCHRR